MTRKVKGKARKIVTKKEKVKKTVMKKVRCFHEFFDQLQKASIRPRTTVFSLLACQLLCQTFINNNNILL